MYTTKDLLKLTLETTWADSKDPLDHHRKALSILSDLPENPLRITRHTLDTLGNQWKARGLKGSTRNRLMSTLRSILRTALRYNVIPELPEFPRWPEGNGRERVVSTEEHHKLLHYLPEPHWRIEVVLWNTGARLGEILSGNWGITEDTLILRATKNGEDREVPVTESVLGILRELLEVELPTASVFHKAWARARERMGLGGDTQFVPHALRHTCATRLVGAGVPLPVVAKWMGHRDLRSTMRYVHPGKSELREALKRVQEVEP